MPKFKAVRTEYHQVASIYTDTFDTKDEEKWEWLKNEAEFHMPRDEFDALPEDPPKDPEIWMTLYGYINSGEFSEQEDDWITVREGGYDVTEKLLDAKGKPVPRK
jgi:hypothetical protein